MNVYVITSWSPRGAKCVGVNMNQRAAQNAALHAVEEYIQISGCDGAVGENEELTEFWPENARGEFRVRIDVLKLFLNFANR